MIISDIHQSYDRRRQRTHHSVYPWAPLGIVICPHGTSPGGTGEHLASKRCKQVRPARPYRRDSASRSPLPALPSYCSRCRWRQIACEPTLALLGSALPLSLPSSLLQSRIFPSPRTSSMAGYTPPELPIVVRSALANDRGGSDNHALTREP